MKRGICGPFAIAVVLSSLAFTESAWAAKRVVVEHMGGPGGAKLRQLVTATLGRKGYDIVSEKRVATAEADLGLLQASDNYPAAAKELKAIAFVGGSVSGKKRMTAKIKVKGADGSMLGEAVWRGNGVAKLLKSVKVNLAPKLAEILLSARKPREEVAAAAADDEPKQSAKSKRAAVEAEIEAEAAGAASPAAETASREPEKSAGDQFEESSPPPSESRARKRRRADDEESSSSEEASVSERRRPSKAGAVKNLDLAVGAHIYGRQFRYNQNLAGGAQEYQLPVVPAPSLALDYFVLPYLGLTVGGEYSVGLVSEDTAGNRYRTSSFGYWIGAKGRYLMGPGSELTGIAAYAGNSFSVKPETTDAPQHVAGVDYKQVRNGLGARFAITDGMSLIAGADYLHLLSMGDLQSEEFFPYATGRGGQGFAGLAFNLPWMAGLEARATVDIRRYVFSMNSEDGDKRIAGGAVDQYIGGNLSFGLRQ